MTFEQEIEDNILSRLKIVALTIKAECLLLSENNEVIIKEFMKDCFYNKLKLMESLDFTNDTVVKKIEEMFTSIYAECRIKIKVLENDKRNR